LINECSNDVTVFDKDAKGIIEKQTISSLPPMSEFNPKDLEKLYPERFGWWAFAAHIMVTPDNKQVIVSNRGHNSLAVFDRNTENGKLTLNAHYPTGGDHPRNFDISKDGKIITVANQDSDRINCFIRNP
jgi:6-phosphogluconolactonase